MSSADYWERAALKREIAIQENAGYTAKEIIELYEEALDDINEEIRKIRINFQKRFGLDNDRANFFLTKAQNEENLKWLTEALENAPDNKAREKILDYIHRDGLSVRAYSAREERFEAVKTEIYARIKRLSTLESTAVGESLKKCFKEAYYGLIDDYAKGINAGINFSMLNDRAIEEAISAKWHGARFSERIWKNTDRLAEEAQGLVVKSIMSGESHTKTAKKLSKLFETEEYNAVTLIRTETAHVHRMADFKAYEELEIEEYKYLATLDYITCSICQPLDGMVFKVSEAREGENCPVMHPRCRCTTTLNIDYHSRRAKDPVTGKYSLVDGNTTYSKWVEGLNGEQKAALDLARKKDSRKTSDKLQHEQYKKLLGTKIVPKSFDKFQELKYNNSEKWNFIKLDYRRQHTLINNPELSLPNARNASADNRKFTEYLFGGNNEKGLAKGRAITSRLGYDINNYQDLKDIILKNAASYPIKLKNTDTHGIGYEQKIVLYGIKDSPANVVVGWKVKDNKTWLTSAYIKEVE